jgi:peptidoglycan-associated lipoprotein
VNNIQRTKSPTPRLLLCGALLALLGACSSTPMTPAVTKAPEAVVPVAPPPVQAKSGAQPQPAPDTKVATVTLPAYLDPKNAISTDRSVYFEFDASTIAPTYDALLERHGKYLSANRNLAVKIEGNADERGSAEYNLALGQRRAESVLRALKIYGVQDKQMEPTSWGKEKPKASGHDEAAWAQNRRADLQYPAR